MNYYLVIDSAGNQKIVAAPTMLHINYLNQKMIVIELKDSAKELLEQFDLIKTELGK